MFLVLLEFIFIFNIDFVWIKYFNLLKFFIHEFITELIKNGS